MKKKQRISFIDIAKALAIICVVLGHTKFAQSHFLYLFHVVVFLILSGHFFQKESINSKKQLSNYFYKRFLGIYIPYFIGNLICILFNNIFIELGLYSSITHQYLGVREIVFAIIKNIFMIGDTEMLGASWFLRLLFGITILYSVIEYLINRLNKGFTKKTITYQTIISLLFLLLIPFISLFTNIALLKFYIQIPICYWSYHFGRIIGPKLNSINKFSIKTILGSFSLSFFALLIMNHIGSIEISKNIYTNILFFISTSIAGYIFIVSTSLFLDKFKTPQKILTKIGQNTMAILLLHLAIFKIVNIILVIILNDRNLNIYDFPTTSNLVLPYIVPGLSIPVLTSVLYERIKNGNK